MSKAIFIASSHTDYKDSPGERYHFPNMYLSRVAQTVGDWVIFYQGRRGGHAGYYGVQRVTTIVPDPEDANHSYAMLDRGSELSFERLVPRFRDDATPFETGLPVSRGSNTSAVRIISDGDFAAIVSEGLRPEPTPDSLPRNQAFEMQAASGFGAPLVPFEPFPDVVREQVLSSRAFRDQAFARQVKQAYRGRCAMSGLELRNGGGRPEVEAAHILPVGSQGPDIVQNGMALSGTVHWMFDRGLVSVDEDHTILISKDSIASEIADRLFVPDRHVILPDDPRLRPLPAYLSWHRSHCFKG